MRSQETSDAPVGGLFWGPFAPIGALVFGKHHVSLLTQKRDGTCGSRKVVKGLYERVLCIYRHGMEEIPTVLSDETSAPRLHSCLSAGRALSL